MTRGRVALLTFATIMSSNALPGTNSSELTDYKDFLKGSLVKRSVLGEGSHQLSFLWMAPFFSGGGYCSEATTFMQGMQNTVDFSVGIVQHGDSMSTPYMFGLSSAQYDFLQKLAAKEIDRSRIASICHSEPGAWQVSRSLQQRYSTSLCPALNSQYRIGRTMFETDRLPNGWVERMNGMNEIWVPTAFMRDIVIAGGLSAEKVLVVPEPVDVEGTFDPAQFSASPPQLSQVAERTCVDGSGNAVAKGSTPECPVRFLSVGKWERRKGFDVLLRAYLTAFSAGTDHVELYLLTSAYHSTNDFKTAVDKMIKNEITCGTPGNEKAYVSTRATCVPSTKKEEGKLPPIHLLTNIPQGDIASVYASVDVLVQPSRGEGWGRPHVEAMSMGLPIIATLWSGPSEFMTDDNSYPLGHNDTLLPIPDGAFAGHLQAEPDAKQLAGLMQQVYNQPEQAAAKGKKARDDMVEYYHPNKLARFLNAQFERVERVVLNNDKEEQKKHDDDSKRRLEQMRKAEEDAEESRKRAEAEAAAAQARLQAARAEAERKVQEALAELERPRVEAERAAREAEERARNERERASREKEDSARRKRDEQQRAAEEARIRAAERAEAEQLQRAQKARDDAMANTDLNFNDLAAYAMGGDGGQDL